MGTGVVGLWVFGTLWIPTASLRFAIIREAWVSSKCLCGDNRVSLDRFATIPKDAHGARTGLPAEILAFPPRRTLGKIPTHLG